MSTLPTAVPVAVPPPAPSEGQPPANAGALPTGQKVYTYEHWTRLIGYQVMNAALTALWVFLGVMTANPFLVYASAINGIVQAGLMLADWVSNDGQISRASMMNSALTGLSLGYLSQVLKIGSMGLSLFGVGAAAALYGVQLYHLTHRNN